jgi:hypothetical protein
VPELHFPDPSKPAICDLDAGHSHIREPVVGGLQAQLYGLACDHQAVVGHGVEGKVVSGQHGILIIALFSSQAKVDFVTGGIVQAHIAELRAQLADGRETGFGGRRGGSVISFAEGLLSGFGINEDGCQSLRERARWIRPGILPDAGNAGVDTV